MNKKIFVGTVGVGVFAVLSVGAFLTFLNGGENKANAQYTAKPEVIQENGKTVKSFELVAKETSWKLYGDKEVNAWTFNGVVPGSQIRATVGEVIRVTLKNKLKEPTSIHWHGYPVPNNMDGIPGMTQNAVRPGETFTYQFEANVPGTYWYHSHQDSANQEDKGLYGTLVVEAKEDKDIARDYTLVLDEWNTTLSGSEGMDHGSMNHGGSSSDNSMAGMNHGDMSMSSNNSTTSTMSAGMDMNLPPGAMHDQMMQMTYTTFSVNGKSRDAIEPVEVVKGERVRLRFVNAGFQSHVIHLHGQEYTIVSTDGQKIDTPALVKDQPFAIAPGERYDIEFVTSSDSNWFIESHDKSDAAKDMTIPVKIKGSTSDQGPITTNEEPVDMASYGQKNSGKFSLSTKYDIDYKMTLSEKQGKDPMDAVFTINGESDPNIQPLMVKKGEKVKVTFKNEGSSNHPMHLHGHFFQILSKNGNPLTGAPIMKDTLNVKPGETYEVAFEADNPGNWMFHCHDLHHAAAGMVSSVNYEGFQSFTPDPTVDNKGH